MVRRVTVGVVAVVVFVLVAMPASATLPGANGKIAFVRGSQLWLMNGDGSGQTLLADVESPSPDNFVNLYSLSWSSDGAKLAFEYRQIGSGTLCGGEDFVCSSIAIPRRGDGNDGARAHRRRHPDDPGLVAGREAARVPRR